MDTDFFVPAKEQNKRLTCITVGAHLRDFETLQKAVPIIKKQIPGVSFKAIGCRRPGGNNSILNDTNFEYFDNIDDLELLDHYQSSTLAIFSLKDSTANNAILEAMSCGLPIVVTDVGGVSEYVDDHKTGLLFQTQNHSSLANNVINILDNNKVCQELSKGSRSKALKYDYNNVAKDMLKLYENI